VPLPLAAAAMLVAVQAAKARVVQKREIASTLVAGGGHASGAPPTSCYVAPCPSPKPQRECDDVVHSGSVWVVAELRVQCGAARALVSKLFRANPNLPGPGLPGWNCHGAKGPNVQGHCEDLSSPKGKVRAIFWWLDEGGEQQPPPPRPPRDRGGWRTVVLEAKNPDTNEVGASARVTWAIRSGRTSGGTLRTFEYYGTVYDKKGDGHHARIFRVNDRSAPWEIAKAASGDSTSFGSKSDPLETSLPAHFRVCIYENDSSIACTDKFRNAGVPDDQKLRQQADRIMRLDYRAFIRLKRNKNKRPPWFNWDDDGCSGPPVIKEAYRHVFNQPCQLHDFGYKNYGQPKGRKLGRNEKVRRWIDDRFLQEMRRLCNTKLRNLGQPLTACLGEARVVWGAVRSKFGGDAFYNG
jgi:Prokaryotic phospholipase A2